MIAPHRPRYVVQVWFGTSIGYRTVGTFALLRVAEAEARAYWSDSRGIRIIQANGDVIQIKAEGR